MIIDRIGIGAVPNDGSGDSLRVGGDKINQNLESFPESLVNFMKFIPEEHRSAIRSGTSTYDIGPRWEYAFTQEQGIEIPTGCVFSTEAALVIPTCGYVRGGGIQATESFALPYGAHPSKIAAIRLRSQTACITQGFASAESYTTGEAWNRLRSCVEGVFIDCGGVADFGFLMLLCNQPEIRRCTVAFARKAGFMVRGTQNFLIEHTRADYCPDGYHFANGCAAGSVIGPWARSYPLRHPDPEAPYDDDDGSGKGRYPLASAWDYNFMRFEDDDSGTELTNYPMANIRCYGPGIQDSSMGVNCIKVLQSGSEVTFRGIHANNMIGYIQARAAFPDSIYYEEGVPLYGPEGPGTGPPCPKIGCIVVGANARVNWDGGTLRCATGGPSETWDAIVHPNGTLNHGPNETFFSLVYGDAPIKSKVFCEGTELWEGRTERPDELSPQAQKFSGDFSKRGFLDFSVINAEWLQVGGFFLTRDEENHQLICTDSTPGSGSAVYCLSPRTMAEAGAIKEGAIWEIEFEIVSITGGYGPGLESINELSIVRSSAYMGFTNPDPDTFEVLTVGSIPGRGWRKGPYRVRAPGLIESRYDSHGNLISGDFSRGFKLSVYGGNPVEVLRLDNCHFRRVR